MTVVRDQDWSKRTAQRKAASCVQTNTTSPKQTLHCIRACMFASHEPHPTTKVTIPVPNNRVKNGDS